MRDLTLDGILWASLISKKNFWNFPAGCFWPSLFTKSPSAPMCRNDGSGAWVIAKKRHPDGGAASERSAKATAVAAPPPSVNRAIRVAAGHQTRKVWPKCRQSTRERTPFRGDRPSGCVKCFPVDSASREATELLSNPGAPLAGLLLLQVAKILLSTKDIGWIICIANSRPPTRAADNH